MAAPAPVAAPPARPWQALVDAVMDGKPALGAVLQHGHPVAVGTDEVVIGFDPGSFFGAQAQAPDALAAIADAAARALGGRPTVRIVEHDPNRGTKTMVERAHEELEGRRRDTEARAREHPVVQQVATVFSLSRDAMTVHVELE
ncbi:MAG: hypothetical protein H6719_05755 [Sandaracinaceae bacterium]|nr:hypothetical protein [Sandaracinaceae bacterium]